MRASVLICSVVLLAGCATNVTQVRQRAAMDLSCESSEVAVELTARPSLGVTRYRAEGCGSERMYECRARLYSAGLPLGERACRREGSRPSAAPDVLGGKVGF